MKTLIITAMALLCTACDPNAAVKLRPGHSYLVRDFYERPYQINVADIRSTRDGDVVLVTITHGGDSGLRTDTFWVDSRLFTVVSEVDGDDRGTCNQG